MNIPITYEFLGQQYQVSVESPRAQTVYEAIEKKLVEDLQGHYAVITYTQESEGYRFCRVLYQLGPTAPAKKATLTIIFREGEKE